MEAAPRIDTGAVEPVDPAETIDRLRAQGVRVARVSYSDIHGRCRSKDLALAELPAALERGLGYCLISLLEDLRGNPLLQEGFAGGSEFPDMRALPDLTTARVLPWDRQTVWMLADLERDRGLSPRGVLRRACAALAERGLEAIVAPELEFYLLRGDRERHGDAPGLAYTMGARSDPGGGFRAIHLGLDDLGIGVTTAHHEFSPGQFEINLRHGSALDAADRAFILKEATRELAALNGMAANFMAKPFTDAAGNGFHLHVSLLRDGANAAAQGSELSPCGRHFLAGVLAHAPALTALGSPTTNSYRRLDHEAMAPQVADWGHDHRFAYVRIPPERGEATRIEVRGADASANPYLVTAATLLAGLAGIERGLEPPPQRTPGAPAGGATLPIRLEDALAALESDTTLTEMLGGELVEAFCALKRDEVARSRRSVTDWEWREYAFHA